MACSQVLISDVSVPLAILLAVLIVTVIIVTVVFAEAADSSARLLQTVDRYLY